MNVGYAVALAPQLASFRLRVARPAIHLGCDYTLGALGAPTFFYKHAEGDVDLACACRRGVVYDVVNDHFAGELGNHYRTMCTVADEVTTSSERMAEIVSRETGRTATVIDDPYENEEEAPGCAGQSVLWFGHGANATSLSDHINAVAQAGAWLTVCSNFQGALPWSLEAERVLLARCAFVLLTGNNPGASSNRVVKALRAGRFVVTPGGIDSWQQFKDYIWIGDVAEGVRWALTNRDEACQKVTAGQDYVRERFSPKIIGAQWRAVFDRALTARSGLTSERDTSVTKDGRASISLM